MGVTVFPDGMEQAPALSVADKVMIAGKDGGAPTLASIQQIKNLLVAIATGQVVPQIAKPGDALGSPEDVSIFYAGPGTYVLPAGNLNLEANLNLLIWDKEVWDFIAVPVNVDLSGFIQLADLPNIIEGSNDSIRTFYGINESTDRYDVINAAFKFTKDICTATKTEPIKRIGVYVGLAGTAEFVIGTSTPLAFSVRKRLGVVNLSLGYNEITKNELIYAGETLALQLSGGTAGICNSVTNEKGLKYIHQAGSITTGDGYYSYFYETYSNPFEKFETVESANGKFVKPTDLAPYVNDPLYSAKMEALKTGDGYPVSFVNRVTPSISGIANFDNNFVKKAYMVWYKGVTKKIINAFSFPIVRDFKNGNTFTASIIAKMWINGVLIKTRTITTSELAFYNALTTSSVRTDFFFDVDIDSVTINAGDNVVFGWEALGTNDRFNALYTNGAVQNPLVNEWGLSKYATYNTAGAVSAANATPTTGTVPNGSVDGTNPGGYTTYVPIYFKFKTTSGVPDLMTRTQALEAKVTIIEGAAGITEKYKGRLILPPILVAAVGKELSIYYDSIVMGIDKGLSSPVDFSVEITCAKGNGYERNWYFKPVVGDVGTYTFTANVYDSSHTLIDSKSCSLKVINPGAFGSQRILVKLGDSTSEDPETTQTVQTYLASLGGVPPVYKGPYGDAPAQVLAKSGWSFSLWTTNTRTDYILTVTGVSNLVYRADYQIGNSMYRLLSRDITAGSGTVLLMRMSGSDLPSASGGTINRMSYSTGDATITYSGFTPKPGNPLLNSSNILDVPNFRASLGMGATKFDLVEIDLGINDANDPGTEFTSVMLTAIVNQSKSLINAFLNDNTSGKVLIHLPKICCNTISGWGSGYGSVFKRATYIKNLWALREAYLSTYGNFVFSTRVHVGYAGLVVDRYNGYPLSTRNLSAEYNGQTEPRHTDALHPSSPGRKQVGNSIAPQIADLLSI